MRKISVMLAILLVLSMIASTGLGAASLKSSSSSGSPTVSNNAVSTNSGNTNTVVTNSQNTRLIAPLPVPPLNENPIAEIVSISPDVTFVDTTVNFVGRGFDPENGTKYFKWDFNCDGNWDTSTSNASSGWAYDYESYSYTSPGTYSVLLKVTDVVGNSDTDSAQAAAVVITINIHPATLVVKDPASFNAVVEGFCPTTYSWDFDDGQSGSGQTVEHSYSAVGNYNGSLTVSSQTVDPISETFTVSVVKNTSCDLTIGATYTPDPPQRNQVIHFQVAVTDKSGNYDASSVDVSVESNIPGVSTTDPYEYEWGGTGASGYFSFIWPDDTNPYYVNITAIPIGGFTEENPSDNSINLSGLHPTSLSFSIGCSSMGYSSISTHLQVSGFNIFNMILNQYPIYNILKNYLNNNS